MKKILFYVISIILTTGCSNQVGSGKDDSSIADSLAMIDKIKEATKQEILDSIRQDSIAKTKKLPLGTIHYLSSVVNNGLEGSTYDIYKNGKIKTHDKCITAGYEIRNNGEYYVVSYSSRSDYDCGEFYRIDILVQNSIYMIYAGTEYPPDDVKYNSSSNTVKLVIEDSEDAPSFLETTGFPSMSLPLTYFEKVGTIQWNN